MSEVTIKEIKECNVYYKEGVIEDFSRICDFIMTAAKECTDKNPDIKCPENNYCFINYLENHKENKNVKIRYTEEVESLGEDTESIKFKKLEKTNAISLYHKGSYKTLSDSYIKIYAWAKENGYNTSLEIREVYIDGVWNKENEDDYLTELQLIIE